MPFALYFKCYLKYLLNKDSKKMKNLGPIWSPWAGKREAKGAILGGDEEANRSQYKETIRKTHLTVTLTDLL